MITVGNEDEGFTYDFFRGDLVGMNMYDPETCEWINVIGVLKKHYPKSYTFHFNKADKLYEEYLEELEAPCPLSAYKHARDLRDDMA